MKYLLLVFLFNIASAQNNKIILNNTFNGYKLSDYKDFEKKWHLVTVRYRKDTSEQRFTYANDLAWDSLIKGSTDYPDGSVFAKIGIATDVDNLFPSSSVPSGTRRYQLMIRNKEKHKDTDGWGYAIFSADEMPLVTGEPNLQIKACASCHKIAESRGFVFSVPMDLRASILPNPKLLIKSGLQFEKINKSILPPEIQKHLPAETLVVQSIKGQLQNHIFQGTIDEIRPGLTKKVYETGEPALLFSKTENKFSLVYEDKNDKKCSSEKSNSKSFKGVYTVTVLNGKKPETVLQKIDYCSNGK